MLLGSGNDRNYKLLLYNNEGEFKIITLDGAAWSTDINMTKSFHTSKVREFVSIVLLKLHSWVTDGHYNTDAHESVGAAEDAPIAYHEGSRVMTTARS